ncbi:HNH endonuclease [Brachybacterium sp. AOP42-C2-15]|uniref:HNH endonuclease n=1 Tax=Brachybacterium sp. AOP42-C2-15 TaxID=3457670 RepID=UPI00403418CA
MTNAPMLNGALHVLEAVLDVIAQHPWVLVPVAATLFVCVLLASPAGGACDARDPRRGFTVAERRAAFERAGLRCEHKSILWHRCTNTPTQGDHIYPWSRGGRTAMSNQQALCPFHNSRKSGSVPTRMYILRLQWRRRRYFPEDVSPRVQWRPGAATWSANDFS